MAVTGPLQAPVAFNTVYELDDLVKFLAKTQTDLDTRFELINKMVANIELNECGFIKFENIRKMLENSVTLCEDLAISMSKFTHGLIEKRIIRRNTSLPQLYRLDQSSRQKRDSGIEFESASSSETLPKFSANRLSDCFVSDEKTKRQVSFELVTPSSSSDVLDEQAENIDDSLPTLKQEPSKVFIHLIPADPVTDLSSLKTELHNYSDSLLRSHNIEVQFVQSDTFIGLSARHISTSSSEGHSSARCRVKSSNESLGIFALNNLSRLTAVENSETSDEDNTRILSSSDSDASFIRFQFLPVIEKRTIETQTE